MILDRYFGNGIPVFVFSYVKEEAVKLFKRD
jgi:hypothetical protein